MALPVSFRDYYEAYSTLDPHVRRMKFSALNSKVAQARQRVQQRKTRLASIQAEQKFSEIDARLKRLKAEVEQNHAAALQEQARGMLGRRAY